MKHTPTPWDEIPSAAPHCQPFYYTRLIEGRMRQWIRWNTPSKSWTYDRERFDQRVPGGSIHESFVAFGTCLKAMMDLADRDARKAEA